MIIFAYVFIAMLIFCGSFIFIAIIIENYFKETHPVKKWWRKHVVAEYPHDYDN